MVASRLFRPCSGAFGYFGPIAKVTPGSLEENVRGADRKQERHDNIWMPAADTTNHIGDPAQTPYANDMKLMIFIGITVGGLVGGWLGGLMDHGNMLGGWSILFSGIGSLVGIWAGYKVAQNMGI